MKTPFITSKILSAVLMLFLLATTACDRTHFRSVASTQDSLKTPDYPVDPIPVDPTPVDPVPVDPVTPTPPPVIVPPPAPVPPAVVVPPTPVPPVATPTPPVVTPPSPPPPPVVVVPPTPVPPVVTPTPPVVTPPAPPTPPVVVVPPTPVPPVVTPTPPVITPPAPPKPPVVVLPPTPTPNPAPPIATPILKAGACASDSSTRLLSCLTCNVPVNPPAPPQFSDKGRAFIEIMSTGCSVPNKSAPKNYVPPTREELYARFNRLSPIFYPDSAMNAGQKSVVSGLLTDANLQKKVFGGLWYQPPYSDYFETYFGISVGEVVNYVCYKNNGSTFNLNGAIALQSKQYMDCLYSENSFNCKESPDYVVANKYREQLRLAMIESISRPYVPPTPTPAKKCAWESFEGDYDFGGEKTLSTWLKGGYKVGIEIGTLAGRCESVTSLPTGSMKPRGLVKMAGYVCK
jgi:hypothetical protein